MLLLSRYDLEKHIIFIARPIKNGISFIFQLRCHFGTFIMLHQTFSRSYFLDLRYDHSHSCNTTVITSKSSCQCNTNYVTKDKLVCFTDAMLLIVSNFLLC